MKHLGYIAVNERTGETEHLTENRTPRAQLLERLGVQHADKMYCDTKSGETKHIGYIARGGWWRIYEVYDWQGKV